MYEYSNALKQHAGYRVVCLAINNIFQFNLKKNVFLFTVLHDSSILKHCETVYYNNKK